MKIDGFIGDVLSRYSKQAKAVEKTDIKQNRKETVASQDKSKAEDRVEISNYAKTLAQLGESDTDRAKRIESIKSAIENDSYKPNIDSIAKSILKEWKGE